MSIKTCKKNNFVGSYIYVKNFNDFMGKNDIISFITKKPPANAAEAACGRLLILCGSAVRRLYRTHDAVSIYFIMPYRLITGISVSDPTDLSIFGSSTLQIIITSVSGYLLVSRGRTGIPPTNLCVVLSII